VVGAESFMTSWSIPRKLLLLLLVIFLPSSAIITASGLTYRRHEIQEATRNAQFLVQSLADRQEQIAIETKQMLGTLAQLPEVQEMNASACNGLFFELNRKYPFYSFIGATTLDGNVFASSPPCEPNTNFSDRKHIIDAVRTLDFTAGEFIVGRVSKVQSINFAYPVLSAHDKLIAILTAGVRLDEYARFLSKVNLPEGSVFVITDHSGICLFRFPENVAVPAGSPIPIESFQRVSGERELGTYEGAGEDGVYRTYAFKQQRLKEDSSPYLYLIVGIAKDRIVYHADFMMLGYLSILGILGFLAMYLALSFGNKLLTKPINQLVEATRRFGKGEMNIRTGLPHSSDEVGQLAKSFDAMASLVEMRDIERKQAEEALRRSQRQLADIIEFFPDATFVINNEGTVIAWNRAMEEMTGIPKSKMIGKGDFEYSLPFFGNRRPALLDLVFASEEKKMEYYDSVSTIGGAIVAETYAPDAHGGKGAYLWGVATALFDEQGNVTGAIESIRDINERKLAEIALRESEERFSRFFRASPAGTGISRLSDGHFIDANDAFLGLFGYTREEAVGHSALELGIWANLADRSKMLKTLEEQGRLQDFETQFRRKSGEIMDALISAEVIEMAGQQYMLGLTHDITERKRGEEERKKLEEQLFQAQKMESVGRLAGGVAHDFNNMLSVIIGRAEMALEQDVPTEKLKHNLDEILKAGLRSADLTRQLLGFARKQTAVPKILDLNNTISGMLKMLRRLISEDIDLSWQPGLDLWKVKIDPSQVDQILANLVVNARDAIFGVGAVTMRTENVVIDDSNRAENPEFIPGQYVLLTVSDTGAGMTQEVRENIFEPFFTTKEVGKGTGLGLSTVYGIVKQNDGFIYVASEPGEGTTFRIYLPRFEAETAQVPSEHVAVLRPTGTETILLVEDDEAILNLGKIILENLGYTVLAARTPGHAIHLAEEHPGDIRLLITDVVMPEMHGRELAEKLSAIRPNLKCLYMSGYTADVIAHRGILDEGLNFIQKPFGGDDLAARVRQMLDHLE